MPADVCLPRADRGAPLTLWQYLTVREHTNFRGATTQIQFNAPWAALYDNLTVSAVNGVEMAEIASQLGERGWELVTTSDNVRSQGLSDGVIVGVVSLRTWIFKRSSAADETGNEALRAQELNARAADERRRAEALTAQAAADSVAAEKPRRVVGPDGGQAVVCQNCSREIPVAPGSSGFTVCQCGAYVGF